LPGPNRETTTNRLIKSKGGIASLLDNNVINRKYNYFSQSRSFCFGNFIPRRERGGAAEFLWVGILIFLLLRTSPSGRKGIEGEKREKGEKTPLFSMFCLQCLRAAHALR
jgi:hypothetical protein